MSLPIPTTRSIQQRDDPAKMNAMDAPLIALTNQCNGDLRQLMFAYFSFLNRRTDFYLVPHPEDVQEGLPAKMGFVEGDAEKLLLAAFRQFPLRRIPKGADLKASKATKATNSKKSESSTSKSDNLGKKSKKEILSNETSSISSSESNNKEKKAGSTENVKTDDSTSNDDNNVVENKNIASNMKGIRYNEEGLQIPIGNGGSTPQYKWTQTLDEATVMIGVPKTFRGKDFDVSMTPSKLSVKGKKSLPGEKTPRTFLKGTLTEKIRVDESTWTLENGVMMLGLNKSAKKFWRTVLTGDEAIDTELVDSRTHISDYDDATQAQFRKIIFDQTQYHLDLPYSDEILGKQKNADMIPNLPPGVECIDKKTLDDSTTELPPGVEYINKKTLDEAEATKRDNKK
jgi:HSP20 family molecular chaperone IbpA